MQVLRAEHPKTEALLDLRLVVPHCSHKTASFLFQQFISHTILCPLPEKQNIGVFQQFMWCLVLVLFQHCSTHRLAENEDLQDMLQFTNIVDGC